MNLLAEGSIEVRGRMPWSSNGTYLVTLSRGDVHAAAVYKPARAERRLWDFPHGLHRREVAAYELSLALGWPLVPETVDRADGPLGAGSLQRFVDADFEQHYFTLVEDPAHHRALKRMAVFDVTANNADRKGGHCLLDGDGHVWGIDHGLCFHAQPKLRTVIWDFAGDPIDDADLRDLERLVAGPLPPALAALLEPEERAAVVARARRLLRTGRLPEPRSERPYPWPLV